MRRVVALVLLLAILQQCLSFSIHMTSFQRDCMELQCPATAFDYGVKELDVGTSGKSLVCSACQQCTDAGYSVCMRVRGSRAANEPSSSASSEGACSCAHSVPANCHAGGRAAYSAGSKLFTVCYLSALQTPPKPMAINEKTGVIVTIEPFWQEQYWRDLELSNLTLNYEFNVKAPEHCDGTVETGDSGLHLCKNTVAINMAAADGKQDTPTHKETGHAKDEYEHSDNYDDYDDSLPPEVQFDRDVFAGALQTNLYYTVKVRRPRQLQVQNQAEPLHDTETTIESEPQKFDLKPEEFGTGLPDAPHERDDAITKHVHVKHDDEAKKEIKDEDEDDEEKPTAGTDFFEEDSKKDGDDEEEEEKKTEHDDKKEGDEDESKTADEKDKENEDDESGEATDKDGEDEEDEKKDDEKSAAADSLDDDDEDKKEGESGEKGEDEEDEEEDGETTTHSEGSQESTTEEGEDKKEGEEGEGDDEEEKDGKKEGDEDEEEGSGKEEDEDEEKTDDAGTTAEDALLALEKWRLTRWAFVILSSTVLLFLLCVCCYRRRHVCCASDEQRKKQKQANGGGTGTATNGYHYSAASQQTRELGPILLLKRDGSDLEPLVGKSDDLGDQQQPSVVVRRRAMTDGQRADVAACRALTEQCPRLTGADVRVGPVIGEGRFGRLHLAVVPATSPSAQPQSTANVHLYIAPDPIAADDEATAAGESGATSEETRQLLGPLMDTLRAGAHANIISLQGVCRHNGCLLVAWQPIGAADLRSVLRESRVPVSKRSGFQQASYLTSERLLNMAVGCARGAAHLSARQVPHPHLAACNVVVGERGAVRIAGFGLQATTQLNAAAASPTTNLRPSRSRWQPPEHFALPPIEGRPTARWTVWSLGVLLWEIVTLGMHLSLGPLSTRHQSSGGTPFAELDSRESRDLLDACLEVDVQKRTADLPAVVKLLEDMLPQATEHVDLRSRPESTFQYAPVEERLESKPSTV